MKEYQFYELDRNSIRTWLGLLLFIGAFIILPIVMGLIYENYNLCIVVLIGLILFIWPAINYYTTKITINSNGIERRSYFKRAYISWQDVKSLGVYSSNKDMVKEISNPQEPDPLNILWGTKYIYVSVDEVDALYKGYKRFFSMNRRKISNEYIDFLWRAAIFDEMENYWNSIRK